MNNKNSSTDATGDAKRPAESKAWPEFEKKLAAILAVLQEDQFLILSVKRAYPFVQFAAQGAYGLRTEAISNHFLPRGQKLSNRQQQELHNLGWSSPTGSPSETTPERQPDGSPNFFRQFSPPISHEEVAHFAVQTFVEVLRVYHPGTLEYQAFDANNQIILLPTLGLAVRPSLPHKDETPRDDPARVRQTVRTVIREATSNDNADFDKDGDIPIRFGSAVAYVRVIEEPLFVRIFSPVLVNVEEDDALLRRLNDINCKLRYGRLMVVNDSVIAALDIFTSPLIADHVARGCALLGDIADQVDDLLQEEFGGRTAFGEFRSPTQKKRRIGFRG